MYYYAELDENDVCIGVFESLEELTDPIYIEIASLFVHEGEDGMLNIGAQDLIYPLIACIQHLLKRT